MHGHTPRAARTGRLLTPFVFCAAVLGACSDVQPLAYQAEPPAPAVPVMALQALDCMASRTAGVTCTSPTPGMGGASAAIIGGQNLNVRLASSNAGYNAGTGIFTVDVTLQNLLNEAIGTPDGVTPDPAGIMVFFYAEPYATGSSTGNVDIENEDGIATFTSLGQAYHTYHEILQKDEVSAIKQWQFAMPNTVHTFRFTVLVAAEVQPLLVINEVLANPGGTITDADGEWVELYNAGSLPVNLEGLVIADSAASGRRPYHRIASSIEVPSGGYVVLGNSTNTTSNGGVTVDYSYGAMLSLANSLDAIKIARVFGADTLTIDRTQYSSAAVSAQNGISRELKNPALDNSNMDGSNWGDASVTAVYGAGGRGTPKAQNSAYAP